MRDLRCFWYIMSLPTRITQASTTMGKRRRKQARWGRHQSSDYGRLNISYLVQCGPTHWHRFKKEEHNINSSIRSMRSCKCQLEVVESVGGYLEMILKLSDVLVNLDPYHLDMFNYRNSVTAWDSTTQQVEQFQRQSHAMLITITQLIVILFVQRVKQLKRPSHTMLLFQSLNWLTYCTV